MAMVGLFATGFVLAFVIMYKAFPTLDRATLTKRALPGFSIALPSGEKVTEEIAYPTGKVMLKRTGDRAVVIVQWEPGAALSSEELRMMVPIFGKFITGGAGTTKLIAIRGPERKPLETLLLDTDDVDLELTSITCGVRHMLIATAASSGLARLHQRIVSSFECHPDAAQESQSAEGLAFPLKLDLPGWHLVSKDSEVTQISNDSASLALRTIAPMARTPDLADFISTTFEQMGAKVTILEKHDDYIKVKLQDAESTATGWISLVKCPQAFALVMALVTDDAAGTELYARVKAARCLQPGEAPVQFPEH